MMFSRDICDFLELLVYIIFGGDSHLFEDCFYLVFLVCMFWQGSVFISSTVMNIFLRVFSHYYMDWDSP